MANTESKVFISDIGLAAVLLTLKFPMVGLERASEKRIDFVFVATDEIKEVIDGFWRDEIVGVPIQTLFQNFRFLKNRLYAAK